MEKENKYKNILNELEKYIECKIYEANGVEKDTLIELSLHLEKLKKENKK